MPARSHPTQSQRAGPAIWRLPLRLAFQAHPKHAPRRGWRTVPSRTTILAFTSRLYAPGDRDLVHSCPTEEVRNDGGHGGQPPAPRRPTLTAVNRLPLNSRSVTRPPGLLSSSIRPSSAHWTELQPCSCSTSVR